MNADQASSKTIYIGSEGPLQMACEQVFEWNYEGQLIVILWHEGWLWGGANYWQRLQQELEQTVGRIQILVTFFGETPDSSGSHEDRRALTALTRALAIDIEKDQDGKNIELGGWSSITDFNRLWDASVPWSRKEHSALLRLCQIASDLFFSKESGILPRPTLSEFFHFLADPATFRTKSLHDKPKEALEGLRSLKWLDVCATFNQETVINILVVENKPNELTKTNEEIGTKLAELTGGTNSSPLGFLPNARFYLVKENFLDLRTKGEREKVTATIWHPTADGASSCAGAVIVPWKSIDLVLQDIVLDDFDKGQSVTGLDLVPHYFEACPQALVFMLTSLDVETLVGSGDVNWKYVDCLVSKNALATIWYEYRRCFRERFGRMFWSDWPGVVEKDRKLLRNLFGTLRRWQIEPDILWHGQTLPEMIDHANRHITALWKLVNDFVGTLIEYRGADAKVLSLRHRVALAVAVWMHDVGHRGDEFITGSMDIRASHAGISERLLLRNPDAYRLGWLLEGDYLPHSACNAEASGRDFRLECRNKTECTVGETAPLCLMREIGLLCRHHQSNAPLDEGSLKHMATRGKEPSIYSLAPDCGAASDISSEDFLFQITNDALPMPWPRGLKVMQLKDFRTVDREAFRALAGLLRMLDAMQLHRSRVGSSAFIAGFNEFVETKFEWCRSERIRLEEDRRAATPGRKSFQRTSAKLSELDEYEILLKTQQVHFWRQAAVDEVDIRWIWKPQGKAIIDVCYTLDEHSLSHLDRLSTDVPNADGGDFTFDLSSALGDGSFADKWIRNLVKEVLRSEHKSQYLDSSPGDIAGYLGSLIPHVDFRVSVRRMKYGARSEEVFPESTPNP